MNDFTKNIAQALFNQDKVNDFLRKEIQTANNVVKRKAKPKAEFPSEQSLDTFIGIQTISYNDRYFNCNCLSLNSLKSSAYFSIFELSLRISSSFFKLI